jgi:glycosyltransferase involved in cell wall biosynthesis
MISLMHHAIAVIQPSTFEGWSTSVEESKAMGKQIILSSIDVHVEQAPERGIYFSPHSPDELVAHMVKVYGDFSPISERLFAEQRPQYKSAIERDWIQNFSRIIKLVQ